MLSLLSGRSHDVVTGAGIVSSEGEERVVVTTRVTFAPLTASMIARYWATGEPLGKAGSYGIQGLGGALVTRIEGSYTNVVGLPLYETTKLLQFAGIDILATGLSESTVML